MKTLDQVIGGMPADRRARINKRAQQLIEEEMALRHLREARQLTQATMAQLLGIGQDSVSRLENRSDLLLSTLKSYVEAMGGSLKLVVEFPDGQAVLSSLGDGEERPARSRSAEKRPGRRRQPELVHVSD